MNAPPFSKKHFGGDERDRTDDPLLAKQVLSQLSYTPRPVPRPFRYPFETFRTSKIKQRLSIFSLRLIRLLTLKMFF